MTPADRATWQLQGTDRQQRIATEALTRCDYPFEMLKPSLAREAKTTISAGWEDLSRYATQAFRAHDDEHSHVTDGDAVAHPIEREVDGRRRVLGLFYLPPHTRVVLDTSLEQDTELAAEVLLAEAAHAVDYHHMTPEHRRAIVNLLHDDDLPPGADVSDGAAFELDGHTCSWFDVGAYRTWVGEAFMETFTEAFSDITVTIALDHPTGPEQARAVREVLLRDVVFGLEYSSVVHDAHRGIAPERHWPTLANAQAEGRRGCRVCKP